MIVAGIYLPAPLVIRYGAEIARVVRRQAKADGVFDAELLEVLAELEKVAAERPRRTAVATAVGGGDVCRSEILTVKQAAALIDCEERNVRDLIDRHRLRATRAPKGRAWLIDKASVEAYVKEKQ